MLIFIAVGFAAFLSGYTSNAWTVVGQLDKLTEKVERLEKLQALRSTYCDIHAKGKCGPCECTDDFNLPERYYCDCRNQPAKRDCMAFRRKGHQISGVYKITFNGHAITQVYCDQTTSSGGWTVIQRRMDGSENFFRNWQQYKSGFGQLQREFWLGNENIHKLTMQSGSPKGTEAMFELRRFHHPYDTSYNRYKHFHVNDEASNYRLNVTGPSGTLIPHHLTNHQHNQPFSTFDRDNDGAPTHNCAKNDNYGGWWYNGQGDICTSAQAYTNLNGPFDKFGMIGTWYKTLNWNSGKLLYSEIKVRRAVY